MNFVRADAIDAHSPAPLPTLAWDRLGARIRACAFLATTWRLADATKLSNAAVSEAPRNDAVELA
ncbi:MAG: hypothetical protein L6Q92_10145 [Phycisphaerae bacterium]|nr:hypothetical protein [Phycisphaerae bacterium]